MKWQVGLYAAAVLIPLAAFAIEVIFIRQLKRLCAYLATGAIGLSFLLSLVGFVDYYVIEAEGVWAEHHARRPSPAYSERTQAASPAPSRGSRPARLARRASIGCCSAASHSTGPTNDPLAGKTLSFPLGVYIDNLSVLMFLMVTFIATLIHIYSMGYMHDDSRYPRFFAYLSLFCFSMLGLVASSNVFMIFIFWELVGICSYLLDRLLVRGEGQLRRGQQGVHRQPDRRRGDAGRSGALVDEPGHVQLPGDQPGSAWPDGRVQQSRRCERSGGRRVPLPRGWPPSTHRPCRCLTGC